MKYFRKLEGEHVYFSPMHVEDAEIFVKWLNNPEINQYLNIRNSLITLLGEKEFGRRHEALFQDGKYHDLIYMELINK